MSGVAVKSEPLHPAFLRLSGLPVLVVGGGAVALEKTRALVAAGAKVTVVAPSILPEFSALEVARVHRQFDVADVASAWFVIAAASPEVNREVSAAATSAKRFVVAVDDVRNSTAFGASTFERGGITIALSSSGAAPALVALLRRGLEALVPSDVGRWRALAEGLRPGWREAKVPFEERRPALLRAINALYMQKETSSEATA